MGLEGRGWYREEPKPPNRLRQLPGVLVVLALVGGLVLAWGVLRLTSGKQPTFEGEQQTFQGDLKLSLLPGLPSVTLHRESLYVPNDQWKKYLADERTCPGGERTDLPLTEQATIMVCLVNYAREQRSLTPLVTVAVLNGSSLAKAERVVRCREVQARSLQPRPRRRCTRCRLRGSSARTCTSPTAV